MDALLKSVEIETAALCVSDDDLSVDHATIGKRVCQGWNQLRKVSVERLLISAGELNVVAISKDDAAEAVPLRFVQQIFANRNPFWPIWRAWA